MVIIAKLRMGDPLALPNLTAEGRLPAGRHVATMAEIKGLFVDAAPNRTRREMIFSALTVYLDVLKALLPSGAVWVNGGFVTHKPEEPKDADLVIVLDRSLTTAWTAAEWARMAQMLTLQGVQSAVPTLVASRLQPMGGLLDAYFVEMSDVPGMTSWDAFWSAVKDAAGNTVPGAVKGYLEVTW